LAKTPVSVPPLTVTLSNAPVPMLKVPTQPQPLPMLRFPPTVTTAFVQSPTATLKSRMVCARVASVHASASTASPRRMKCLSDHMFVQGARDADARVESWPLFVQLIRPGFQ